MGTGYLEPYVASVLSDELVTVQRAAIGILRIIMETEKAVDSTTSDEYRLPCRNSCIDRASC